MQVFQSHEGVVPVADFFLGGGGEGRGEGLADAFSPQGFIPLSTKGSPLYYFEISIFG